MQKESSKTSTFPPQSPQNPNSNPSPNPLSCPEMERAETTAEDPIITKIVELRTACQEKIRIQKQRSELAASSFHGLLRLDKSKAEENVANREKLGKLKDYLRELENDLGDAQAVKTCKRAEHTAIAESISATVARTEQLQRKVQEQKARRDECAALMSQQLHHLEALEEKSKEDMSVTKNIEEVIMWYRRVLGFRTEGGEGVKFIFNNIDLENPDKEYAFTIRLDGDIYNWMNCDPYVEDINELIKDLNETNDLYKLVRIMREKFQAAAVNGALPKSSSVIQASSSTLISSPPPVSVDSRSETPMKENVPHLQPTKARPRSHHGLIHGQVAAPSPQSISNLRRSPRLVGRQIP